MRTLKALACSALLFVCVTYSTQNSIAQTMSMGMSLADPAEIFSPQFSRTDFDHLASVMELTGDDLAASHELYEGYAKGFELRRAELIESQLITADLATMLQDMEIVRKQSDQAALEKQWKGEAREKELVFLADLKSLLAVKDLARWDLAERELRRMKERVKGLLLAETADIMQHVRQVAPARLKDASVREALDAYALDIDAHYRARSRALRLYHDTIGADTADPERADRLWDDVVRARVAVRESNERAAARMIQLLGEDGPRFERVFFDAAYGVLLAPSVTTQIVRAAPDLPGITPEARDNAQILAREYDAGVRDIARRSIPAAKERELSYGSKRNKSGGIVSSDTMPTFALNADSPLGKLRTERAALDARTRKRIFALFSAQERATLFEDRELMVKVSNAEDWTVRLPADED